MKTQPPEQNPNDYDEVTRLRLQLHHAEAQRDAFQKAFNTEVLKVMRVAVIQATISTDNDIARLASEVDGLSAQLVELDDLKEELARVRAKLERVEGDHAATLDYVRKVEAEKEKLLQKVMHMESTWPRDRYHGGKVYNMPDEQPLMREAVDSANLTKHEDDIRRGLRRKNGGQS
jgi:chromosome segregation ATPase